MNVTTTSLHSYADAARRLHLGVQAVRRMVAAGQLVAVRPAGCARLRILGASMLALAAVPLETRDEGAVMRDGPNAFEDVFARMHVCQPHKAPGALPPCFPHGQPHRPSPGAFHVLNQRLLRCIAAVAQLHLTPRDARRRQIFHQRERRTEHGN